MKTRDSRLSSSRDSRDNFWKPFLLGAAAGALVVGFLLPMLRPSGTGHSPRRAKQAAPAPVKVQAAYPRGKGRIAIVLDDWGYSTRQLPAVSEISQPLTISVLPNLPYSAAVARAAHEDGDEVILHMPMEAQSSAEPKEHEIISTGMSREQVIDLMGRSLASVPFARGMNNHQGSKATADAGVMKVVIGEAKRRNLYYLDSVVTPQSVCGRVAKELKARFARRSVFLDNDLDPAAIRQSLVHLAKAAAKEGKAIGIGHDRPATLQVLEAELPALEQAGYTVVPASEIVDTQ